MRGGGKVVELGMVVLGKACSKNIERIRYLAYGEGARGVLCGAVEDVAGRGGGSYTEEHKESEDTLNDGMSSCHSAGRGPLGGQLCNEQRE